MAPRLAAPSHEQGAKAKKGTKGIASLDPSFARMHPMFESLQSHFQQGKEQATNALMQVLGPERTQTLALRKFALTKVPLMLACSPSVIRLDDGACVIALPLNWRTKNHFRSMYFGALAVGADAAGGLLAMHHIDKVAGRVSLIFKDFKAEFVRRPEGDVHFSCADGGRIAAAVAEAEVTGERVSLPIHIEARVPSRGDEQVATFVLTLSLKRSRR